LPVPLLAGVLSLFERPRPFKGARAGLADGRGGLSPGRL